MTNHFSLKNKVVFFFLYFFCPFIVKCNVVERPRNTYIKADTNDLKLNKTDKRHLTELLSTEKHHTEDLPVGKLYVCYKTSQYKRLL